jgi:hypothetical protein
VEKFVKGKLSKSARVLVALGILGVLASAGHYAYGEMQTQAMAQPQERELYKHHEEYKSALHEDQSVHQKDLDNRADMLGVEQDFFRGGATNFIDPGYRDLPNAAQMQLVNPSENDRRTANTTPH